MSKDDPFRISVSQIERQPKIGQDLQLTKVVFTVERKDPAIVIPFEVPVLVSTTHFDEEHLVKVARHYLHGLAAMLAEQTKGLALTKDWFDANALK